MIRTKNLKADWSSALNVAPGPNHSCKQGLRTRELAKRRRAIFWFHQQLNIGSKSKHREMETYETNPDFARVSFLRNTKSAALGVSGFEKRNIRVPRAVSPAIRLNISFPSSGMWGVTGETGRRREQAKY